MADITNSSSLTDFQRNAREFIQGLNDSKVPLLLTVNGKVQAVLVDPATYQKMEERLQRERFLAAIKEGLKDIDAGDVRPVEDVIEDVKTKYGL
jgi:PHD/YefM family antitoxin component YafN of YafNO toxin-antitoxin module